MKKYSIYLLFLTALVSACGEAGIQSDISQIASTDPVNVEIEVSPLAVGQYVEETDPITVETEPINISSSEFDDYAGDVTQFTINKIWYAISDFDPQNEADLEMEMNIIFNGGSPQHLLTTTINDVQNVNSDILMFDKNSPGSVNTSAIASLESALLNGSSFEIQMVIVGKDVTFQTQTEDFDFQFKFDVTARVKLD